MPFNVADDLKIHTILEGAMEAFKRIILPLRLFSTKFENVPLKGTDTVHVPYYPLATSASKDFDDDAGYEAEEEGDIETRPVKIDKRKYQSMAIKSRTWNRMPMIDFEKLGRNKGRKLAEDVIKDIFSLVKAADFGVPVVNVAPDEFDFLEVLQASKAGNDLMWPETGRGMVLNNDFDHYLKADPQARFAGNSGDTRVWRDASLGARVGGFDYERAPILPDNGENLAGFICFPSAVLVGQAPIEPEPSVREQLTAYEIYTDPDSGLTLEYRAWGDPGKDTGKRVIECNYGFGIGEKEALRRFTKAA